VPRTLSKTWADISPNARGALWILAAALLLSAMAATLKFSGRFMSVWELLLIRSFFALGILLPALARGGFTAARTARPLGHLARGVLGTCAFSLFYLAVTHLELTLVVTLGFTRNLFVVVLAALLLGEAIRLRRTAATLAGFVGVVICTRPESGAFDPWTLAAVGFALVTACVTIVVKKLTATESPLTIVFYTYVYMAAVAVVPAWMTWSTPSATDLLLVALVALFSTLGQTCMVHGLRAAETTAVTPFEYTRILYAFAFGYFLFGEVPAASTWVGGSVIIASTLYIAFRNAAAGAKADSAAQ
jgi:drug/metabolite transporter (DMT)-like permease